MSCVSFGAMFDNTEITPKPPKERIGKIWSSLPEYTSNALDSVIVFTWSILPDASFIATTFLFFLAISIAVSGYMFTPVLDGTLYIIIGIFTLLAIHGIIK